VRRSGGALLPLSVQVQTLGPPRTWDPEATPPTTRLPDLLDEIVASVDVRLSPEVEFATFRTSRTS
jgi:hypothetical protein